jgi:hypothetical protein
MKQHTIFKILLLLLFGGFWKDCWAQERTIPSFLTQVKVLRFSTLQEYRNESLKTTDSRLNDEQKNALFSTIESLGSREKSSIIPHHVAKNPKDKFYISSIDGDGYDYDFRMYSNRGVLIKALDIDDDILVTSPNVSYSANGEYAIFWQMHNLCPILIYNKKGRLLYKFDNLLKSEEDKTPIASVNVSNNCKQIFISTNKATYFFDLLTEKKIWQTDKSGYNTTYINNTPYLLVQDVLIDTRSFSVLFDFTDIERLEFDNASEKLLLINQDDRIIYEYKFK